jgi:hypothetical protein
MIKIKDLVGIPSLQYHLDNDLTLHENIYRYSSDSFIQLFNEARDAWRDGYIQLNEEDVELLESTDIGLYGMFEGQKVPLDLPMVSEEKKLTYNDFIQMVRDDMMAGAAPDEYPSDERVRKDAKYLYNRYLQGASVDDLFEAEYKGREVSLNKPKRGGPKKFFVYVKNPKTGNVKKVNFGDSGNLSVKIKEPGARASFAARHKCAQKKDKTKAGYWSCNIGRYWKSLGGSKNFSGYW